MSNIYQSYIIVNSLCVLVGWARLDYRSGKFASTTLERQGVTLTRTQPGDQVFSYAKGLIRAVGTVTGACMEQEGQETLRGYFCEAPTRLSRHIIAIINYA